MASCGHDLPVLALWPRVRVAGRIRPDALTSSTRAKEFKKRWIVSISGCRHTEAAAPPAGGESMHPTLRGLPRRIGRTQAVLGAMLAVLLVAAPLSISPAVADTPPGGANVGRITAGDLTTEHLTDRLGISVSAP